VNSFERMQNRLKGAPVDRVPNWDIFMTLAAHHVRQPLSRYYLDHRVLVDANLAMVEDFSVDVVQAISDPYREAAGFGAEIEFPADALPLSRKPRLAEPHDLQTLHKPNPVAQPRMLDRLQAVQLMRQKVGREIPVMGWVEGALAEAGDLRGAGALLLDVVDRPDWLHALLELCADTAVDFARAQVEAGADIVGLGDALASQLSPAMYRRYALPYEQRIFTAIHAAGALTRLHICGNTTKLLPDMAQSGADIIDLDWMVDLHSAGEKYGAQFTLCGNMNPVAVMLQGTPDLVYASTRACLLAAGPLAFSGAGCEIPDGTPSENLLSQARALRDAGALSS
jgi:MtaA/CmuA family methyltransferase